MNWRPVITPNDTVPRQVAYGLIAALVGVWLGAWMFFHPPVLPGPYEVLGAFPALWLDGGLFDAMLSSFLSNLHALALSIVIALPLAYLSRVPLVRPLAIGISKLRFLSPGIFYFLLLFAVKTGSGVKLWMLVSGEVFFLLTSMLTVVLATPDEAFDDARTLRMNEWQATWYVVVRGTLPEALAAIRDNQAIGWSMVMMVEGFVRSEGGVGVMINDAQKYLQYADVGAIVFSILGVGILVDRAFGALPKYLCPYIKPVKS